MTGLNIDGINIDVEVAESLAEQDRNDFADYIEPFIYEIFKQARNTPSGGHVNIEVI